jgi:hypothetical protein
MGTVEPFIHLCRVGAALWVDLVRFLGVQPPVPDGARGREPVSPEAAGAVPGAAGEAPPRVGPDAPGAGATRAVFRLARGPDGCPAHDPHPVAPPGLPPPLALAVPTRTAPPPRRAAALIAEMARSNPTWGEERIAAELLLKLGIRVSPGTVRR